MQNLPPGFLPYSEPSPFLERIGPLFQRAENGVPVFGLRVLDHHCNRRRMMHGGVIVSLADIALGKTGEWSRDPPASLITASLTVEFLAVARPGDWVEATCAFHQVGGHLAFANCYVTADNRNLAHASGVFKVVT